MRRYPIPSTRQPGAGRRRGEEDRRAGDPRLIASGETVATRRGRGRVRLRLVDGAMRSLGEATVLRIDVFER